MSTRSAGMGLYGIPYCLTQFLHHTVWHSASEGLWLWLWLGLGLHCRPRSGLWLALFGIRISPRIWAKILRTQNQDLGDFDQDKLLALPTCRIKGAMADRYLDLLVCLLLFTVAMLKCKSYHFYLIMNVSFSSLNIHLGQDCASRSLIKRSEQP